MLAEAFRRLQAFGALTDYEYLGFGAREFIDFELFWRALGISRMTSIERDEPIARFEFNAPFGGVNVVPGEAKEALPLIEFAPHAIVWLDYTNRLDVEILADIRGVARRLGSGSALVVTVSAAVDDKFDKRRAHAIKRLESKRVPLWATDDELGDWGVGRLSREILSGETRSAIRDRGDGTFFEQLFNFHYKDTARMLTWGGLVVAPRDRDAFAAARFDELEFVRNGRSAYLLDPPVLTIREMLKLNERLMDSPPPAEPLKWLSEEEIAAYRRLHRWYPTLP